MIRRGSIRNHKNRISIKGKPTGYSLGTFWKWAYSNIDVPLLRGVLVEYLIVQKLIDNALHIAGPRICALTHDTPKGNDLKKSLSPFYSYQMHGDWFDLQLHWGVTIEIKSTFDVSQGKVEKKEWWGPINGADKKGPKVFPAQYYILAEVERESERHHYGTNLPKMTCYVLRGRDLDRAAVKNCRETSSVSFKIWTDIAKKCSFDELPGVLRELQDFDVAELQKKLRPNWKINRSTRAGSRKAHDGRKVIPVAEETESGMCLRWVDRTDPSPQNHKPLRKIIRPWRREAVVDWRDWEAAGFRYERMKPVKSKTRKLKKQDD